MGDVETPGESGSSEDPVQERRRRHVGMRVFTVADIRRIAELVEHLGRQRDPAGEFNVHIEDEARGSADGSRAGVIDAPDFLEHRRVVRVQMTWRSPSWKEGIDVELRHSTRERDYPWGSHFIVEGTSAIWVNGATQQLADAIHVASPQYRTSAFVGLLALLAIWAAIFLACFSLGTVIGDIEAGEGTPNEFEWWEIVPAWANTVLVVAGALGGLVGALWVMARVLDLWPHVELQTGPAHRNREERKRRQLRIVLMGIVGPLVFAFLPVAATRAF